MIRQQQGSNSVHFVLFTGNYCLFMDILLEFAHLIQFDILKLLRILGFSLVSMTLLGRLPLRAKPTCMMLNLFLFVVYGKTAVGVVYFIQGFLLLLIWFLFFHGLNEIEVVLIVLPRIIIRFRWSTMLNLASDSLLPLGDYCLQDFDFLLLLDDFVYYIHFVALVWDLIVIKIWRFFQILVFHAVFKDSQALSVYYYLIFIIVLPFDCVHRMPELLILGICCVLQLIHIGLLIQHFREVLLNQREILRRIVLQGS